MAIFSLQLLRIFEMENVNNHHHTSAFISRILIILALAASASGLIFKGLYNDNLLVQTAWRGNDLVTLLIGAPLLAISLFRLKSNSPKALLMWLGALWYMFYNYMFYLFGAAFNELFLVYTAIFAMSGYAFVLVLMRLDVVVLDRTFVRSKWLKPVAGFILFFAFMLGLIEIAMCLDFLFTGEVPQAITQTGHPTGVVFATDLSILIPMLVVGGFLLWRQKAWGYILSGIALVKASAYGLVLIVMSFMVLRVTGVQDAMLPLWIFLTLGCWASTILLFKHIRN